MARQTKAPTQRSGSPVTINIRIKLSRKAVWVTTGFLAGIWVASLTRLLGMVDVLRDGH